MDTQDRERDIRLTKEEQLKYRTVEYLQEFCQRCEITDYDGKPSELIVNVRKRVVEAVCRPLLRNPNVEVMFGPTGLTVYNNDLHSFCAMTKALSFNTIWIGNGPFIVFDAATFQPKSATLEDVLVMNIIPVLSAHFETVLKEVSKLILYVPLSLSVSTNGISAKTRYATFVAPF